MWSDQYNYYYIQGNESLSRSAVAKDVIDAILKTGCFIQVDNQVFSGSETFPWVNMVIENSKRGEYAATNKKLRSVNLIAIVCSKDPAIDQSVYIRTFLKIAASLQWKLYLEPEDGDNRNVEIKTG